MTVGVGTLGVYNLRKFTIITLTTPGISESTDPVKELGDEFVLHWDFLKCPYYVGKGGLITRPGLSDFITHVHVK